MDSSGMNPRAARGFIGEQDAGFFFGAHGYGLITGPGGTTGGHQSNQPGVDGAAYNPIRDHLILYDNKAFRRDGNVASATAIDPVINLARNIQRVLDVLEGLPDLPWRGRVRELLEAAYRAVTIGGPWPEPVDLLVTNAWGNSQGISAPLARRGIRFLDIYNPGGWASGRLAHLAEPPYAGKWTEAFGAR
jgi:hypothetical protein